MSIKRTIQGMETPEKVLYFTSVILLLVIIGLLGAILANI
jgi:hypothetical protein